jgi:GNAT superfamily N-acetyltransferase
MGTLAGSPGATYVSADAIVGGGNVELVRDLGVLALGSRLKALSDRLYEAVDRGYAELGFAMDSRWFPLLQCVHDRGPVPVSDAAEAIGQTHSAVSQLAARLVREGLLERRDDPDDGRHTHLCLSSEGEHLWARLGPAWLAMRQAVRAVGGESLLASVAACEAALEREDLATAIKRCHAHLTHAPVMIEPYRASWRDAFRRLNERWLRRYFEIEDVDARVLADPETHILAGGGRVLFATIGGEPVGTCALLRERAGLFELTKMAVDPGWQGRGIGARLLQAAIDAFHALGGGTLFLESSSRLGPALRLYERAGFERQPGVRPGSHYARADVYMIHRGPAAGR